MLELPTIAQAEAQRLITSYREHFGWMDDTLIYTGAEVEMWQELAPDVVLMAITDARGTDADGQTFVREDKTANPRKAKDWRKKWRMSAQALTYGLLAGVKQILVRQTFKSDPPMFDHEWFTFSQSELDWWRDEVINIGREIMRYKNTQLPVWPLNIEYGCLAYGPNYPCVMLDAVCSKQEWGAMPAVWAPKQSQGLAKTLREKFPQGVVLSASGISSWMRCRFLYQQQYEKLIGEPENEHMALGKAFHEKLAEYTRSMMEEETDNV